MNTLARWVTRIYAGLLRLYPRRFRAEFSDEMQSVFADTVAEAAARGKVALVVLWWALMLVLSLYLMEAATPGLWFLGYTFGPRDLWGWRSWIPLAIVVVLAFAWTRSLRPLGDLIGGVWRDWTRLSFALFGLLPFALFVAFDEIIGDESVLLVLNGILALGALVYMRVTRNWQRALALLVTLLVCWSAATVFKAAYWSVLREHGPAWVTPWESTVRNMLLMGEGILVVMFAPALLGLIRRAVNTLRPA